MVMKPVYIVTFILLCIGACAKNPFWVGKTEFITLTYSNSSTGPTISSSPTTSTPFIAVESITATNIGNETVQIVLDGVRIESKNNNFEIDKINIFEKTNKKWEDQSEFTSAAVASKTDIACVLVLDMSTSLSDVMSDLKTYAKDFVDEITSSTPNSKIGVVFFSSSANIVTTSFYDASNAEVLKSLIDNFSDYKDRTALFEATLEGVSMLDNLNFSGPKSLVVFTDGGDNDSDNPDSALSNIKSTDYFRVSIGLKGKDFVKDDVKSIASTKSNFVVANNKKDLKKQFAYVALQVSSVFKITYDRSDQLINDVQIKFEFKVDKIK